jgi:hypothetical protein
MVTASFLGTGGMLGEEPGGGREVYARNATVTNTANAHKISSGFARYCNFAE